jgi:hypothetical protein
MSESQKETAPAVTKPSAMKGKLFAFRQNALKAGLTNDDIDAATESFETVEDIDAAMSVFRGNDAPEFLKKKEDELKAKQLLKHNKAGTPPDKLEGSQADEVVHRFNTKSEHNLDRMNILNGALPTFRYNKDSGDLEVI